MNETHFLCIIAYAEIQLKVTLYCFDVPIHLVESKGTRGG